MFLLYIVIALLALLLMVTIHEFGHYIVGKLLKFKINEFSIGFGPKIFSRKSKKTGEIFSIRLFPLGGFCAFEGEDEVEKKGEGEKEITDVFDEKNGNNQKSTEKQSENTSNQPENKEKTLSFNEQKPWKRLLVLVAGAGFNFISAIIFSIIFLCVAGVSTPIVHQKYVDQNGIEYNAQLKVGDEIVAINGNYINVLNSYSEIMAEIKGDTADFIVIRNGEKIVVTVEKQEIYVEDGESYKGFGFVSMTSMKGMDFLSALLYCVPYTLELSWAILGTLGQLLTGQLAISSLSGPVSTIQIMAQATQQNWVNMLVLLPLISANLALFNVLPIPALDGSKMVFTAIEWIRGKPINRNVEAYIHMAGFFFLIGLCIVVELFHFFG